MVDFEKKKPLVLTNEEINTSKILFKVGEYSNFQIHKNKKNKKINTRLASRFCPQRLFLKKIKKAEGQQELLS